MLMALSFNHSDSDSILWFLSKCVYVIWWRLHITCVRLPLYFFFFFPPLSGDWWPCSDDEIFISIQHKGNLMGSGRDRRFKWSRDGRPGWVEEEEEKMADMVVWSKIVWYQRPHSAYKMPKASLRAQSLQTHTSSLLLSRKLFLIPISPNPDLLAKLC